MATTPTRQTGLQPQFISPMIAAALLAIAVIAGVWYVGRETSSSDDPVAVEAPVAAAPAVAVSEGAPARGGLAEQIAEGSAATARGATRVPPAVYIVASEPAAHAIRMAVNDADNIRASMGERPLDHRVVVLPVEVDAETVFAEERRQRDYEGMPQFELVDLRQSTVEGVTP